MEQLTPIIIFSIVGFTVIGLITFLSNNQSLNGIKNKVVGDGQHGTAKFANEKEIKEVYKIIDYTPDLWREGKNLPTVEGLIVGSKTIKNKTKAIVDSGDIHALMIGAAGVGKTAYFLYPNIEYCLACGMSFMTTDTKGDIMRNYGNIAKKYYNYNLLIIDLRNPTKSDSYNLLHLVNKYMDLWKEDVENISYKAKAEKYAKIVAKTIVNSGSEEKDRGQNAFFYDSAEGLITATILLLAEFCEKEERHIVSVYKLIQELLEQSEDKKDKGKNQFQLLIQKLPETHKARWFAGSSLNTSGETMMAVISTALSKLNTFLDSEMESMLCVEKSSIDTEKFCKEKTGVFVVLPEEDNTKYFMASLIIQQMYREILTVADEMGGKLNKRVMFYLDEIGTIPKIDSLEMMYSAIRSRKVSIVGIIQSFAQLNKNYGKEGAEIIIDNSQVTIFGGFAPNSESAEVLSKSLGEQTVLSGSVSRGKNEGSKTLQMMNRALMTPDELKSLKKGNFIVTKTGANPMKSKLKLFFEWGIKFEEEFYMEENKNIEIKYASKEKLVKLVEEKYNKSKNLETIKKLQKLMESNTNSNIKKPKVD
ncbi:VirD4-like conjugal transfer protein, CD1115 family [uncultured Tyzzerella sp.]|uniref:VirD4-like conjugal transfer protein, CD1115 family n=1 Tax=uncultured Tyzzerella sp. TaxID=2321398 RepID=UPI002941F9C6|nr:type IV secretory system conjugative DNA transfer family protein [uncultured Tyzzerella sp.]